MNLKYRIAHRNSGKYNVIVWPWNLNLNWNNAFFFFFVRLGRCTKEFLLYSNVQAVRCIFVDWPALSNFTLRVERDRGGGGASKRVFSLISRSLNHPGHIFHNHVGGVFVEGAVVVSAMSRALTLSNPALARCWTAAWRSRCRCYSVRMNTVRTCSVRKVDKFRA
jgi:hypothetical protein